MKNVKINSQFILYLFTLGKSVSLWLMKGVYSMRKFRYYSASYTVEAVFVFPIFFFSLLIIIYCMLLLQVQLQVNVALGNTLRQLEAKTYYYDLIENDFITNGAMLLSAEHIFKRNLELTKTQQNLIHGGSGKIHLFESSFLKQDHFIDLIATYQVELPLPFFSFCIPVRQRSWGRGFVGRDYRVSKEEKEFVFIAKTGVVYHLTLHCSYLRVQTSQVLLQYIEEARNQIGAKYYACRCCKPKGANIMVYITDYGTKYHASDGCSQIKREVQTIPRESVGNRRLCSKCSMYEDKGEE